VNLECSGGRVRIEGDMTIFTAAELKSALAEALASNETASELDLSQVTEFDSAGLQIVLAALRKRAGSGSPLQIGAASRAVRDILDLLHQTYLLGSSAPESAR
jgi:anti-anti-sigma factor